MTSRGAIIGAPLAPEVLGEALARLADHRVGGREDRLGRAVVLLQRDDARRRVEEPGEVEDVADLGAAEAVDRLGVVADDGQAAPVGLQPEQDLRLQPVGVLILVDEDMVEAGPERGGRRPGRTASRPSRAAGRRSRAPGRLLGLDVAGEERLQLGRPADPGRGSCSRARSRAARRRSPPASRSSRQVPFSGNRLSVRDSPSRCRTMFIRSAESLRSWIGEGGIEADRRRRARAGRGRRREWKVPAQVRPAVRAAAFVAEDLAGDALDAALHLRRGASGEGHQQDAARVGAREDQVGDAVRQRVGLAGAGAGDDQQRAGDLAVAVQDGACAGLRSAGRGSRWRGGRNGAIMFIPRLDHVPLSFSSEFVRVRLANCNRIIGLRCDAARPPPPQERREAVPRSASRACRRCAGSVVRRTFLRRGKLHPGGQQKATI